MSNSYEIMGQCGVCNKDVKRDSPYDTIEFNDNAIYICRTCAASYSQSELHEKLKPAMKKLMMGMLT